MYRVHVDGIELFLLGRALMKLGEEALPEPPGGSGQYAAWHPFRRHRGR